MKFSNKFKIRFFLIAFLSIIALIYIYTFVENAFNSRSSNKILGVTFSTVYSKELGFEPMKIFNALVDDLGFEYFRIPVYWSELEKNNNKYDWSVYDEIMNKAQQKDLKITLVVGAKIPRWPECYIPKWTESLKEDQKYIEQFEFVEQTVTRYKKSKALIRWQVENEPFFPFGNCPKIKLNKLFDEIKLVRELDDKPIQMTTSGELSSWFEIIPFKARIIGISIYRETWNPIFGYFHYPIPPLFYKIHAFFVLPFVEKIIISELQAEPWFSKPIKSEKLSYWYEKFDAKKFKKNIDFAEKTGINEIYLWGAEWWYLLKENGEYGLWNTAKELLK